MSVDLSAQVPLETVYWLGPTDITQEQISNMAASILIHGQIEPIIVCPRDEKGYRGVCGRLRYEGLRQRWRSEPEGKTILARVHKFKDEADILMWQLAENLHRRDVSAMQRALQVRALYDQLRSEHGEKATLESLAMAIEAATGNKESVKTIQHYLSLTKLEPETQAVLTSEKLPLRAGLELLRVEDAKKQVKAAEEIQKHPDRYKTVQDIRWHVEGYVEEDRRKKQLKRLEKKAEELRKKGRIVLVDGAISWNERRERCREFYGEIPANCKDLCNKLGILLSGNFQQKPICTDPKCYDALNAKEQRKQAKERKELEQKFDVERAKVYGMEPDARHWRLALVGLMENYELAELLNVKGARFAAREDVVWLAVNKLDEKQCQKLLIRKAVEEVLKGPQAWRGESAAKTWTVKEFKLTPEVFLKEEEVKAMLEEKEEPEEDDDEEEGEEEK